SPEQMSGHDVDGRADLFSIGATLYEILCGQTPFQGMARFDPPAPLRSLNPDVPAELDDLILRSLVFAKDQRIATAGEMLEGVRRIAAASAINLVPTAVPVPAGPAQQQGHVTVSTGQRGVSPRAATMVGVAPPAVRPLTAAEQAPTQNLG